MTVEVLIRQLHPGDAEAYRSLRLSGLKESPDAFGSDFATESASPVDAFATTLETLYVAGAFDGDRVVAIAGFRQLDREKTRHRGDIWGVYVAPDARGKGVGRRLLESVLEHARGRVQQVHLSVTTTNAAALALYQHLGFTRYGTEPRSLMVGGRYLDEHLMVLHFS